MIANYKTAPNGRTSVKVSNHMVGAVLTTLFCCLVGGIVSIVYSAKVNTRLAQGDVAGAQAASKVALRWIIANIILGALVPIIGIIGILMGALSPAISSSMLKANMSAAAMKGRNLFVDIVRANTEREAAGLPNIWPRTADSPLLSDNERDIAGMPFWNATDYFKVLFDMKSYGKDGWAPYLSVDMDVLRLSKTGSDRFCDWIVAANVRDEFDDNIPVLISANVDPATLKTSYDGSDNTLIPIGSEVGRRDISWGDFGVVVVRKNGSVLTLQKKYFTYGILYNRQKFSAPGLKYLDVE